jgi:hypothetical protein
MQERARKNTIKMKFNMKFDSKIMLFFTREHIRLIKN